MASSGDAVLALKVHLSRKNYKPLASLKDGKEFLLQCYPSLEVKQMEICDDEGVSRWVVVCCTYLILVEVRPVNTSHFTDLVKDSRALLRGMQVQRRRCAWSRNQKLLFYSTL